MGKVAPGTKTLKPPCRGASQPAAADRRPPCFNAPLLSAPRLHDPTPAPAHGPRPSRKGNAA
jgi:hypothetical protein